MELNGDLKLNIGDEEIEIEFSFEYFQRDILGIDSVTSKSHKFLLNRLNEKNFEDLMDKIEIRIQEIVAEYKYDKLIEKEESYD